jgi:hypothetical protein
MKQIGVDSMTEEKKKHKNGRPRKYKTASEVEYKIDKYFAECDEENRPYTVTGLALALGMSRQDLLNYSERTDDEGKSFFDTIKKAKNKIESRIEEGLLSGRYNSTGAIFNLKNNYGWKDKQEVEQSGGLDNTITIKTSEEIKNWGK